MSKTPVDIDDTCTDKQMIRELQMKQAAGYESRVQGTITTVSFLDPSRKVREPHWQSGQMTAALHHLQIYRIRSRILYGPPKLCSVYNWPSPRTNFTGPHARVPSSVDVETLLFELDQWRQQAPRKQDTKAFPQQNPDRVQANYFQGVLLLIRPILMDNVTDPGLIRLCVEFAADACEVSDFDFLREFHWLFSRARKYWA